MVTKERVELYKIWFDNMSFFGNNSFVLDRVEDLWNLVNYIGKNYEILCNYHIDKDAQYTSMTKEMTLTLVQQFLDRHNIALNLEQLVKDKTLILENDVFKDNDFNNFFECQKDGLSSYDKNNKKIMLINIKNTILDSAVIVHELMHYRNQPDDKRNFVSDLLTEALSYGTELIFFEDLKDTIYCKDRSLHFKLLEKLMYNYMSQIYYIYKIILIYKRKKDISENLYNEIFKDSYYEKTLEYFEQYVQQQGCVLKDTWTVIGLPLAIYILEEYKKNKNFFNCLEFFNSALNIKSLEGCLETLNIKNKEDLIFKIKLSSNSYIDSLFELYNVSENGKVYHFRKN